MSNWHLNSLGKLFDKLKKNSNMTNETDPILNQDEVHAQEQSTDNTNEQTPEINNTETNTDVDVNAKLAELQDKYIRLYSDFENYKKRTLKEKEELILNTKISMLSSILDVDNEWKLINNLAVVDPKNIES